MERSPAGPITLYLGIQQHAIFDELLARHGLSASILAHCLLEAAVRVIDYRVTVATPLEPYSLPSVQLLELLRGQPRDEQCTYGNTHVD